MAEGETNYRTFPMSFTNVGQRTINQEHCDEQHKRTNFENTPGIFTPVRQQYQEIPTPTFYAQTDPRTAYSSDPNRHRSVPDTNRIPTSNTDRSFCYDDVDKHYGEPLLASTPIKHYSKTMSGTDTKNNHHWRKFFLTWTWFIMSVVIVTAWFAIAFPFHDIVCWLQQNIMLLSLTVLIAFLVSVIIKLFVEETWNCSQLSDKQDVGKQGTADNVRKKLDFNTMQNDNDNVSFTPQPSSVPQSYTHSRTELQLKRTFSGTDKDIWADYLRYFEYVSQINGWDNERKRLVFMTTLRGQAETFVHGLSVTVQTKWDSLINAMELRFGHSNMKESYLAEAKLRRRKQGESFRDLGQAIEDLYRRAYPSNPEIVQENSIRTFLDACGESEEFRMTIRRTKPRTLQEAITNAMQEECIRVNERNLNKQLRRNIYNVEKYDGVNEIKKANFERKIQLNRQVRNNYRNKKQTIVCRNCGRSNHSTENCWSKPNTTQRTTQSQTVPSNTDNRNKGTVEQLNDNRSEQ